MTVKKTAGPPTARLKEERYYERIDLPDHVFFLKTNIEVIRKRKNDIRYDKLKQKVKAIEEIKEQSGFAIINSNRPLDDVLLEIKRKMWNGML